MSTQSSTCPICHARITTLYYAKTHALLKKSFMPSATDFGIYYDLHRCAGCGAVFATEFINGEELGRKYRASSHETYMLEEKSRRLNFKRLARVLGRYVDSSRSIRLLDVGSSIGLFLDTLRQIYPHWSLAGVEASSSAVSLCQQRYGIKLHRGMFGSMDLELEQQDIVTMLDLIEHVHNPMAVIQAANSCLRPGGLLVLTTPNIESWTARLFRRHWWSLRLMHTLYFSPLSMQQMLARGGIRVVKMRGLIRLFTLRYCLRHLGWAVRGPSITVPFPLSLGDMLVIGRKEVEV